MAINKFYFLLKDLMLINYNFFFLEQEYGIQGFPTIKVFGVGNSPIDYQGPRDAKSIAEFALKQVFALLRSLSLIYSSWKKV